jgi:hypothetical protein
MPITRNTTRITPTGTERERERDEPVRRLQSMTEFDNAITRLEEDYGVQLCLDINRNLRTSGDGDDRSVNQWIGEIWYFDRGGRISASAAGTVLVDMASSLAHQAKLLLKRHRGEVSRREIRRAV